ncbi:MAG TPA: TMEM165/GDT1 family protein [Crinalium sp.]|jgi:putative Ca2+/H+ antiporter (TMEM165/GDT1 family)
MLTAFTAGLLLITVSELGDKTFFIAMVLGMRHKKRLVFSGVIAALAAMTVLSVLMGKAVSFLPKAYIDYAEIVLFLAFGIKLLYDASRMSAKPSSDECEEAVEAVNQAEAKRKKKTKLGVLLEAFSLTFLAEWGDRTQFATIALAASNNPFGVTAGAILGHTVCAAIAVLGGSLIAKRISERTITAIGGVLFLLFAVVACVELA